MGISLADTSGLGQAALGMMRWFVRRAKGHFPEGANARRGAMPTTKDDPPARLALGFQLSPRAREISEGSSGRLPVSAISRTGVERTLTTNSRILARCRFTPDTRDRFASYPGAHFSLGVRLMTNRFFITFRGPRFVPNRQEKPIDSMAARY